MFSVDVIHHVSDVAAFFREAHRVLQPGGRVCTVMETEEQIRGRIHSRYFPESVAVERTRSPIPNPSDESRTARLGRIKNPS